MIAKYRGYIHNVGLYFVSSIVVALVGVLLNPIFAMNLSHEDYAIIGYYSSFNLLLIPLLNYCLYSFYSRSYYFTPEEEREELGDTVLWSSIVIGLISLFLFTSIFYVIYRFSDNNFPFYPYAILTFVQLYVANISSFYLTKLRITRNAKQYAKFAIWQCIIVALFSLFFVVCLKQGATGKLLGALLGSIIASSYALYRSFNKLRINIGILKKSLRFCTPLVISALFWYCITGIDRMFLEDLNDSYTFGLYSVGLQIVGYLTIFYTTVANTFEPDIYQAIAQENKRKLALVISIILGTTIVANIVFIGLAPYVIGLLTANRYIESTQVARILSIHNIAMACYYMVVKLLVGYGYVKQELFVRIVGAMLSCCMFYFVIREYGFIGAAWGQTISFIMLTLLGVIVLIVSKRKTQKQS